MVASVCKTNFNSEKIKNKFFFFRLPKLRLLDFRKIKRKDRQAAIDLFKSKKGKEILKEIVKKAKTAPTNGAAAETNTAKGNFWLEILICWIFKIKFGILILG